MYIFRKDDYNFVAKNNETGEEYKIINNSKSKLVRNIFNWSISDTGFNYRSTWEGDDYLIFPTFTGNGYVIRTSNGGRVGKAASSLFLGKMAVTTPGCKVRLKRYSRTTLTLNLGDRIIGNVKTSGVLSRFPISISLDPTNQQAAYLLVFFAILKDGL